MLDEKAYFDHVYNIIVLYLFAARIANPLLAGGS